MIVTSIVIQGKQQASSFEVPTANLIVRDNLDKEGVYAVTIKKEDITYHGVSYFGKAWLLEGAPQRLEVHLFDYEGPAFYGESITVEFHKFLRAPVKFETEDQAKSQIQEDINLAKAYFANTNSQITNN